MIKEDKFKKELLNQLETNKELFKYIVASMKKEHNLTDEQIHGSWADSIMKMFIVTISK